MQIIKQKERIYPGDAEVVGYVDENKNAICYPINEMIMPRHLLNDIFCERPIFVSFCAACRSTIIYNPVVEGKRLIFEVLGVYRRNNRINGVVSRTNEPLKFQNHWWFGWKEFHPNTEIWKKINAYPS